MRMPRSAPFALALLVAACQPARREDAPSPAAASPAASPGPAADLPPDRPQDTVIVGEATWRERIKMPPGAALAVELVALEGGARRLATARVADVAGPPIPFSLPYDPARVRAGARHGLRAELVGPDGERWLATPAPVPVVPGEGLAVELLLQRVPAGTAAAPAAAGSGPRHWECGELGLMSRPAADGALRLDANARTWTLAPARAGGHADARGTTFRTTAAGAQLVLPGEPMRECVPARQPSPWNEALLRGIVFRAVGNEPGWFVEVDGGGAPRLRALLDYGERPLDVAAARTDAGWAGEAGGERVRLEITRAACVDGMSGQRFEATATLHVGARRYAGCGGWLSD